VLDVVRGAGFVRPLSRQLPRVEVGVGIEAGAGVGASSDLAAHGRVIVAGVGAQPALPQWPLPRAREARPNRMYALG